MTSALRIPVVERVFDELKGHVDKDSLSQILLLLVALIQDNLGQVGIFPHQHPHWCVKHLVEQIFSTKPEHTKMYWDGSLITIVAKFENT